MSLKLYIYEVAKVMFLQASVCPQGGECLTRYTPPGQVQPPRPGTPPGPGTLPRTRYTPSPGRYTPPKAGTPPQTRYTPPDQVHPPRYGHCCGRYASYWNAFLLHPTLKLFLKRKNPLEMSFHFYFCIHTSNEPEGITHIRYSNIITDQL